MRKLIIPILFLLCACSINTSYHIDIDMLSFITDEDLTQSIIFPASAKINIFLLPGIEIDPNDSGPGDESKHGVIVDFQPQQTDQFSGFSLKLELEILIENNSDMEKINGDRISIYLAPVEADNIYTDGLQIDLINIADLNPGESAVMTQEFYFEENSAAAEILKSGQMRVGIGVYLTSSAGSLPATYTISRLQISSQFSPIGILLVNYI